MGRLGDEDCVDERWLYSNASEITICVFIGFGDAECVDGGEAGDGWSERC